MRISVKLGMSALLAALVLAGAVSTATAGRISSSSQSLRVTWSSLEIGEEAPARCQVTLEGSLHSRSIAKVERALVGAVTRVSFTSCTNGSASAESLPWHFSYESFTGTLPSITALRLLMTRFRIVIIRLGKTCKYGIPTDRISFSARLNVSLQITNLTPVEGGNIHHLLEGSLVFPACPLALRIRSAATDGAVTVLNSSALVAVRLI